MHTLFTANVFTREDVMGEEKKCSCEEKHQAHLCMLRSKGLTSRIRELASTPNVLCLNCDEEANSEDNVCIPVQLFV